MGMIDPKLANVVVNGFKIDGFAKGTFIEFEQDEDNAGVVMGGKGDFDLVLFPGQPGTLKFTLRNTSPGNVYLELLLELQKKGVALKTQFASPYGGALAAESVVKKRAKLGFSDTGDDTREWEIVSGLWDNPLDDMIASVTGAAVTAINALQALVAGE